MGRGEGFLSSIRCRISGGEERPRRERAAKRSKPEGERALPPEILAAIVAREGDPAAYAPGWPRPYRPYNWGDGKTTQLPVSWLLGREADHQNWGGFDADALVEMYETKFEVCNVCGEELGEEKVFLRIYPDDAEPERRRLSAAGGMHPRCALMSYKMCPHYRDTDPDAAFLLYRGESCGIDPGQVAEALQQWKEDEDYAEWGEELLREFSVESSARGASAAEIRALAKTSGS